jgi:hypothetical protein
MNVASYRSELLSQATSLQHQLLAQWKHAHPDLNESEFGDVPGAIQHYKQISLEELEYEVEKLEGKLKH